MRYFLTGGTGLVGRRLTTMLRVRGDDVVVLSRSSAASQVLPAGVQVLQGDPCVEGPWLEELSRCDGVIHLAGESIAAHRWTRKFKERISTSRIQSTRLIAGQLGVSPGRCRVLVSASAVGYYGMFEDNATEFIESDLPGSGFLPDVAVAWEQATEAARPAVRVAIVRVGVVLSRDGGALPKMALPFRLFLGGRVGSGLQWVSWIHLDDIAQLFAFPLDRDDIQGPLNGTSPYPVTNWGFSKVLAATLRRPCWLPAPRIALRLMLGEMSTLLTHGQRVLPRRATELGFEFSHPLLDDALANCLKPSSGSGG